MKFLKDKAEKASADMTSICADAGFEATEVAARVHRDGIVVFPALLTDAALKALNNDFATIMADPEKFGHKVDRAPGLITARCLKDTMKSNGLSASFDFFDQPIFAEVTEKYFETSEVVTNGEIFVNENSHTETPVNKPPFLLHFDKREVFKFFIYLTDTTAEDGAMRVVPKTVERNRKNRLAQMSSGVELNLLQNVVDETNLSAIPVEGRAGTLFVFSTDVAHGAGQVQPGRSRRIMRGHCHSHEMLRAMGHKVPAA